MLPDAVCRAEEAGGFPVTVGLAGQGAEAFQDVGDEQVRLKFGGARECVVGVAFGLLGLTRAIATRARVFSAEASTIRSRSRPLRRPSAERRSDPRPRCAACAMTGRRSAAYAGAILPCSQAAAVSVPRCPNIAGGQGRVSQREISKTRD